MKHIGFRSGDRKALAKVERVLAETVIHRRQMHVSDGVWPFVVFGPDADGNAVIRTGSAEQMRIHAAPVYIATLGGPHIPDSESVPVDEIAAGDVPEELKDMKLVHISPLRPLAVTSKKRGASMKEAVNEVMDMYKGNDIAVIETPDESYWVLSVLKYLDETDRFFPDPVVSMFNERLGNGRPQGGIQGGSHLH